jgi:RimJ/RimL family protein N-acetyltransferase
VTSPSAPIRSERFELVPTSADFMTAILEGDGVRAAQIVGAHVPSTWPDGHDRRVLRYRAEQLRLRPGIDDSLMRALVLRRPRTSIGHAAFRGPPGINALSKPDAVEVGCTVLAAYRGHGYAKEAVRALFAWARFRHGGLMPMDGLELVFGSRADLS